MATRLQRRNKVRQRLRDWWKWDALQVAINSVLTTTIDPVTSNLDIFQKGGVIKIDDEEMLVVDIGTTTFTVMRAWNGTTATTHIINSVIQIFNFFSDEELNLFIEYAIDNLWPEIYQLAVNESVAVSESVYTYDVPAAIISAAGVITNVRLFTSTDSRGMDIPYEVIGSKIYLSAGYTGTLRIEYIYPFVAMTDDSTDDTIPARIGRLVELEACINALEMMMQDREKYERYTTTVWHQAANPYELDSNLRNLQAEAAMVRDKISMGLPGYTRR